jgi:hypothetical protein
VAPGLHFGERALEFGGNPCEVESWYHEEWGPTSLYPNSTRGEDSSEFFAQREADSEDKDSEYRNPERVTT